jgi:flavin-dependent dehydrogenase
MDFAQAYDRQVEHLAQMVLQAGWVLYAKQRAKELEDDESGLWVGITEKIRERVKELS